MQRRPAPGFHKQYIAPLAMSRLRNGGRLNDEIMYAAIAALTEKFPDLAGRAAVFQSCDYTHWTTGKPASKLFKSVEDTKFWTHRVILIPVFSDHHWMLATVYPAAGTIEYFDSLVFPSMWKTHGVVRGSAVWRAPALTFSSACCTDGYGVTARGRRAARPSASNSHKLDLLSVLGMCRAGLHRCADAAV